jgi:hypothetical protein
MGGDSGVECRGGCAVEHGRRRRERAGAREYRGGRAEEVENGVLFCVKAQRDRARREARRMRGWREAFHAAEVSNGGDRSWISAAVSLSTTPIGPPHLGQRQRPLESAAF